MLRIVWIGVLGALAGCAEPALGPDHPVDDPMLAALPADSALVMGGAWSELRERAWAQGLLKAVGADLPGWEAAVEAELGLRGAWTAVERGAVGCGALGCVGLVEGELDTLDFGRVAERVSEGAKPQGMSTRLGPRRVVVQAGRERVVVRRLSPSKLAFGDASALRELSAERRAGAPGFDPAPLAGLVPAGELFVALLEPADVLGLAAARAERSGRHQVGARWRGWVAEAAAQPVRALALAIDGEEAPVLRLRLRCEDAVGAALVAEVARARLAAAARAGDLGAEVAAGAEVVRVGERVEITARPDPAVWTAYAAEVTR